MPRTALRAATFVICASACLGSVRATVATLQGANSAAPSTPQPGAAPSFEAASIKRNNSGDTRWNFAMQPGGRFRATRASLANLISIAYGTPFPVPASLIVGGPNWLKTFRYDVVAKAEGNPTEQEFPRMLQSLLAERFRLTIHTEDRERDLYVLVRSKREGSLGPNLTRTDVDCSSKRDEPPAATTAAEPTRCVDRNYPGQLTSESLTMPVLARLLAVWIGGGTEVRDATGLSGSYRTTLKWTPTYVAPPPADVPPEFTRAISQIDPNGPSLFTAVQEQLGLRLVPKKEPVTVIVVDRAELPTED